MATKKVNAGQRTECVSVQSANVQSTSVVLLEQNVNSTVAVSVQFTVRNKLNLRRAFGTRTPSLQLYEVTKFFLK